MNSQQQFLTAGVYFAECRVDISIVDWVLEIEVHSAPRICISCGASQSIDGTLPCDH